MGGGFFEVVGILPSVVTAEEKRDDVASDVRVHGGSANFGIVRFFHSNLLSTQTSNVFFSLSFT